MKAMAAMFGTIQRGGAFIGGLGVGGLRLLIPMLSAYAGPQPENPNDPAAGGDGGPTKDTTGIPWLNRRESAIVTASAGKMLLELIEITSRTDPITDGAPPYVAYNDGVFRPPHLTHLLSLASAANRMLGGEDDNVGKDGDIPPPQTIEAAHSVAYVAVAPGEYVREAGPLTPTAIRRSAMRERTYNAPQLAMLARNSNRFETAPAGAGGGTSAGMAMARAAGGLRCDSSGGPCRSCGGSCANGSGCASCGGQSRHEFSPAPRDADGKCVSVFNISCETAWRVRECLTVSICEFIRCVGDEVCDDGKFAPNPDLSKCLEGLVCSLLTCLPEAICPTPPPVKCYPATLPNDCNYATGRSLR